MDAIDLNVIKVLKENSRPSTSEISKRVNIGVASICLKKEMQKYESIESFREH